MKELGTKEVLNGLLFSSTREIQQLLTNRISELSKIDSLLDPNKIVTVSFEFDVLKYQLMIFFEKRQNRENEKTYTNSVG